MKAPQPDCPLLKGIRLGGIHMKRSGREDSNLRKPPHKGLRQSRVAQPPWLSSVRLPTHLAYPLAQWQLDTQSLSITEN